MVPILHSVQEILARIAGKQPVVRSQARIEHDAALAALFETGTAGIAEIDLVSGKYVRANRRFCEIVRRDAAELMTLGPGDLIHPLDADAVKSSWMAAMRGAGRWEAEVRHIFPDGGEFWARVGASAWKRNNEGLPLRCIAVLLDVTESVQVKERLRESEELLRLGQRIGRIGTFERDLRSGRLYASAETQLMFGLSAKEKVIELGAWKESFVPDDRRRLAEAIRSALERGDEEIAVECRIARASNGALRHLEMRARYFYDDFGRPLRSVGVVIDVTERKEAQERLAFAATHDALTGLPNRAFFQERLAAAIAAVAEGSAFSVLCIDLDRFKNVNDTLGHPAGDRLLAEVGARLASHLRPGDTLARLGGDEFAVIQTHLSSREDAGALARRIVQHIREPFVIYGHRVVIGACVGVAFAPRDGLTDESLLMAADLALYQAKASGAETWRYFEPHMNHSAKLRHELEQDLRTALADGQFELHYQPVLDISSLKVTHFEALIRWRHPRRGLVPPDQFLPFCEESGLIVPIGAWVLRRACADAQTWPEPIGVAVNISAVQVSAGHFGSVVEQALRESGLTAARLDLEITETALMSDCDSTLMSLRELRKLGVRITLDDFGAGHSSLGYLQRFPFDGVKIDRAFAKGVDSSKKSSAILKAMLDLCSALGMSTTIEGVETEAQLEAVARMGGERVQGFLFSPARPIDYVPALLEQLGDASAIADAAE